ncbi:MAG: glycosyltransferase family 4 protein [Coriobacteriia bacterium]
MRIAQVAPLAESVPPKYYGGTERVVSYLTEELVRQGHQVTLFASGDSVTAARLVPGRPHAARSREHSQDGMPYEVLMLEQVCRHADEFDMVHFHTDFAHFPLMRRLPFASLTTPHGRLDIPALAPLYREFSDLPVVSVSNAQREPLPWANWLATIHHALPPDCYSLREDDGSYLAFLGRLSPEKRVDEAIEIAKRADIPIRIAAKVDPADEEYYEAVARPAMRHPLVEFVGEIGDHEKQEFLGGALAMLFTIDWPEPFGLVMIEAMACGTPTIAYRRGAVPEVMEEGRTGFVVDGLDEAIIAVNAVGGVDRPACRDVFERRFTVERMAREYVRVYERIADRRSTMKVAAR